MFVINGRFWSHRVTGMQRVAHELTKRFDSKPKVIRPTHALIGLHGHLWEQIVLPRRSTGALLWSPCNTGPIISAHQVVTVHDIIPIEHPEWFSKRFALLYSAMIPALFRRAKYLIAVSEFTKRRIVEILDISENKVSVIPNGIGEEFTPAPPAEVDRVRRALGIPVGPYVLSLCSLEPRKNVPRLLAAWAEIARSRDDVTLVVAGGTGRTNVFKEVPLPHSSKQILFTGYVPDLDLPALYSGASCLVYPSLYEGFGLPVLEALACGTRVVASDSTSIPEIADDSTILVNPLSVAEIASALKQVLDGPSDLDHAVKRRQSHSQRFSWSACATLTEETILSFC